MKTWNNIGRVIVLMSILAVSVANLGIPVGAASTYKNVAGTYTITCSLPERAIDGTRAVTTGRTGTLTIGTDTSGSLGVISSSSIAITGIGTISTTGYIGVGENPKIILHGTNVIFNGQVRMTGTTVTRISGSIDGYVVNSDATCASDAGGTAAGSTVAQESGVNSILLTQAASAGSTHVQWVPQNGIRLRDITTMDADDWGLWFKLETATSGGPQVELRFTSASNVDPDGAGHVDVTLLQPTTGTGSWVNRTYNGTSMAMYYGNDPVDGTAFSDDAPEAISGIVAAINAEGAMGTDSASNWKLTRVRIELWDAGVRTCYVDDVMINGRVNGFEPAQFTGTISAKPS